MTELATTPNASELWAQVKQLRNEGRPLQALRLLDSLCEANPKEFRYALCMAEILTDQGRLEAAGPFAQRARQIGATDPKSAEVLDRLALRLELLRREQAGDFAGLIGRYHEAVRTTPSTVRRIEDWAPIINRAGHAIWAKAGERVGDQAAAIIAEVRDRGIAVRSFDEIVAAPPLLEDLRTVVRTTQDWSVPGKPHFFKAMKEEDTAVWHPIMKVGLHPSLLEIANGFYGLYTRLVSANIVLTKTDAAAERQRQGSEGWHRDPEDTPMFKIFIYLNDVLEIGDGPFQYIPGSRPGGKYEYLMPRFGRGVYDPTYKTKPDWAQADQEIASGDVVTVLGRAGTIFFADTSAFHRGGYCTLKDRHMAAYVYQRPASQFPSYIRAIPDPEASQAARQALTPL